MARKHQSRRDDRQTSSSAPESDRSISRLFAIDLRSLALFRICLASVLVYNIAMRLFDFRIMYTESGVMPQSLLHAQYYAENMAWSLYFLSSSWLFQASLLGLTLIAGLLLCVGWKTRTMTVIAWALIASLHTRAPLQVTGGDVLLSMLLLWSCFLPLGAVWSIDSGRKPGLRGSHCSMASAVILLQMAMMYFFTGISKCNDVWFSGVALQNIYQYGLVARPLGSLLLQIPWFLKMATWSTMIVELVGPPLLFSPAGTWQFRRWMIAILVLLHIGIEVTMRVVIFSFVSLTGLILFLPDRFWQGRLGLRISRQLDRMFGQQSENELPRATRQTNGRWVQVSVMVLAAAVMSVNLPYLWRKSDFSHHMGAVNTKIASLLVCVQRWDMFSNPVLSDYRFAAVGSLSDDTKLDLLRDGDPIQLEDPSSIRPSIRSQRWLGMYFDLMRNDRQIFRHEFSRYLFEQWNAKQPQPRRVRSLQLVVFFDAKNEPQSNAATKIVVLGVYDPLVTGDYINGVRHGEFIVRFPSGQKSSQGAYRRGKPQGMWRYWTEAGSLQGQGVYNAGKMEGRWEFQYENGESQVAWYRDGRAVPPPVSQSDSSGVVQ